MGFVSSYRDLKVWQLGIELTIAVYHLTKVFPVEEKYGLTSQMCRAAVSIPSNIAEGHGRKSNNELIRFLGIAKGSLAELETQLIIAEKLGYCNSSKTRKLLDLTEQESRMLSGLLKSLQKSS